MPTDNTKQPVTTPPIIFSEDTLPPLPQDILNPSPVTTTGSAAPANDVVMDTVMPAVITTPPSKKYAGGKIIATILGLFLLVGGVGAGVYLTGQNQNIAEKANGEDCSKYGSPKARQACRSGYMEIGSKKQGTFTRCQLLKSQGGVGEYESECVKDKPSTMIATASCQSTKAYSSTWTLLTASQLSTLKTGDIVNFCVSGTASSGTFTKAMFTINGVLQSETTMQRPSNTDFCQQYTIPAGTTTFNVVGDIFHDVMGWQ